jgi:hypothetical protein
MGRAEIIDVANRMVSVMLDEIDLLDLPAAQKARLTDNLIRRVGEAITGESSEPAPAQLQLPAPIAVKVIQP